MRRRATAAALVAVLAGPAGALAATPPADPVPPEASAAWLTDLLGPEDVFVDPALGIVDIDATLDILLGLVAAGLDVAAVDAVATRIATDVDVHTGATIDATYVSVTAKLILALAAAGRDPSDVGGSDLVALLAGRVGTDGRVSDRSALGDLSSPRSQALAVLALHRAGADPLLVLRAADALAVAACGDGGVPAEFDIQPCRTDTLTTALAAAALSAAADVAGADAALTGLRDDALAILLDAAADGDLDPWSAGITATALRAADRGPEADELAGGLARRLDGCEGTATGAIVDPEDPLRATVGVLLATSGATLSDLSTGTAAGPVPLDCTTDGDGTADGEAGEGVVADAGPTEDLAVSGNDATATRTGVPAGVAVALAIAVLALALLAGVPVLRRARRRDEAERAAARGA